ncbi:nuclear pore complex protein Nup88 [Lepeophtheirus salmonis]|uniref:nuclear pore complex protein Nup88 n=1 Tax=Lepeophtheirus salmonis TaxID=72036 RepID=UPI001AE4DDCF|nr:nuclear pore complex protein Nup88-like [Lepeophtheirus salmonis]
MRKLNEAGLKALAELHHEVEDESTEILESKDDHIFVWDSKSSMIICIHLGESDPPVQKFSLTDPPMFSVNRLEVSRGGRWIALSGPHGVSCVALPPRMGKNGRLGGGTGILSLKTLPIAERFFLCERKLLIQQVGWHPGSPHESHLCVLSSDNFLRIYDLDSSLGDESPIRAVTLRHTPLFAQSHYSIKSSLGETAVGFSFAPPTEEESPMDQEWPVFILLGNGSVYCLMFNVLHDKKPHRVMGPIPVKHESPEDFCRILCLHPMISSPPIIVLATLGGTLYHCLILHEESDDEASSQISEWSASVINAEDACFSLHVFESIELELGLMFKSEKLEQRKPFDYPIALHPDPTTPGRYFCSHGAGVHCVEVPMIFQLVKMAMNPEEEDVPSGLPTLNGDCIVEHLLCTRMDSNCPPSPVLGVTVTYPPTQLMCLLSNFTIEVLSLTSPQIQSPIPLYANQSCENSPVKKKTNKEPFDERMKMLLQKSSSHPLIKSAKGTDLSPKECLEILTRSTQVLREEYLGRLKLVRTEIGIRVITLKRQKDQQKEMLKKLDDDRIILKDNAGIIAEKYEDLKDNGNSLISRIEVVLQNIQKRLPISSDAELSMNKELVGVNKKMKELKLSLDQVKAKDKYQFKQIEKSQLINNTQRWRSNPKANDLDDYQLESVKDILQQDSLQISDLVRSLNASKKKLSCF